jgi:DNA-directed RNA polymerase subunit omega
MAERPTLVDPPIENLLHKVGDSKFTLVAVTAVRAREINEYWNGLGSGHGRIIPPQVSSLSNKSLSLAMEELYEGKLEFHRPTAEELEQERVQAEADAAALVMAEGELPSLDALLSEVTEH